MYFLPAGRSSVVPPVAQGTNAAWTTQPIDSRSSMVLAGKSESWDLGGVKRKIRSPRSERESSKGSVASSRLHHKTGKKKISEIINVSMGRKMG